MMKKRGMMIAVISSIIILIVGITLSVLLGTDKQSKRSDEREPSNVTVSNLDISKNTITIMTGGNSIHIEEIKEPNKEENQIDPNIQEETKQESTITNTDKENPKKEDKPITETKPDVSKPEDKKSYFILRYVSQSGEIIANDEKIEAILGQSNTFYAKEIEGYELISSNKQSAVITKQGKEKILTFTYKKIKTGKFIIRYIDEKGNDILRQQIRETRIGNQTTFQALEIEGYRLVSPKEQIATLVEEKEQKVITFSYDKIKKGKFIVQYIDEQGKEILAKERIIGEVGITKTFYAKDISGYDLVSTKEQTAILGKEGEEKVIAFSYRNNKKGTFIVKYIDEKGNSIADTEMIESLTQIETVFKAKQIQGYDLISNEEQRAELAFEKEQKEIIFQYKRIETGNFIIQYLDENSNLIIPEEIRQVRINQEEVFEAKELEDYELTSDKQQKGILTTHGQKIIITFTYKKLYYGTITLRYVDQNFKDLVEPSVNKKAIVGKEYSYNPKELEGYQQLDNSSMVTKLTKVGEQEEVIFHLQEVIIKGNITIKYQDTMGNPIQSDKVISDLDTKQNHQITADTIKGYTLQGEYATTVTFLKGETKKVVIFTYTKETQLKDTYVVELDKFHIKNNETNAKETTKGINEAIRYALQEGYKKVKLPAGTYLIDQSVVTPYTITDSENKKWKHNRRGIALESNMQFDIQDCVLKQLPCEEPYTALITISGCENTKVIGGTIIGDKYEHYYGSRINESGNQLEAGDIDTSTGEVIEDSTRVRTKDFITFFTNEDGTTKEIPNQFFVMPLWKTSKNTVDGGCRSIYCYDELGNYLGMSTGGAGFVKYATLQPGTKKIKISFKDETRTDATYFMTERTIYSTYEYGAGITVGNSNNIELVGCKIKSTTGDCIYTYPIPLKVTVDNFRIIDCELSDSRRQGISYVATGENNLVKNTIIKDIAGVDPQCGIDFEHYDYCRNTIIDGCTFYNNKKLDIVNYNGSDIEVKNSKFSGTIAATFGYAMKVHDNYFEYDAKQDSIYQSSGINLQTKDNIVWNNQLYHADINVTGENSQAYGNYIEGGKATIRNTYRNTYKNVETVLIDRRVGFDLFEGSEFINCNINLGGALEKEFPIAIKHCKFVNSKLNARGVTNIQWCDFDNTTKSIQDGWASETTKANYYKCNIKSPNTVFIASGTCRNNLFEECNITTKREKMQLYGATSFKDTSMEFITGDSDVSKVIRANVGVYGSDRSPWYFENCKFKATEPVSVYSDNGHQTNSAIGPVTLDS